MSQQRLATMLAQVCNQATFFKEAKTAANVAIMGSIRKTAASLPFNIDWNYIRSLS